MKDEIDMYLGWILAAQKFDELESWSKIVGWGFHNFKLFEFDACSGLVKI